MSMGKTLKQWSVHRFYSLCHEYQQALIAGNKSEIVRLSVLIHAASGTVPKRLAGLAGRIFRETVKNDN